MQSIVFVNAVGNEVAIWKELTGGQLSDKFFEGALLQHSQFRPRGPGVGVSVRAVPGQARMSCKTDLRSS